MAIKLKTRDPKTTDLDKSDIIININEGSLFYKSNLGLHKLEPTNIVETPSILKESITITKTSESTELEGIAQPFVTDVENSTSVTLKLSDFIGFKNFGETEPHDLYEKHKVLRIENNRGYVEIGPFDETKNEIGNQNSLLLVGGILFRSNRDFYFGHEHPSQAVKIFVSGGTSGGFRSIGTDLFLAPRGGNLAAAGMMEDHGIIQLVKFTANTIVHGDLTVQSNTEDTTDNIGIGNIQADGDITANNLKEDQIILESPNGTKFKITVSNDGDIETEEI